MATSEQPLQQKRSQLSNVISVAAVLLFGGFAFEIVPRPHVPLLSDARVAVFEALSQAGETEYRVTLQCPVKHNSISYRVRAEQAEQAKRALEWMLPACDLKAVAPSGEDADGRSWFTGTFACSGQQFRRTVTIIASDLQVAGRRARSLAPGCSIDIVDQAACARTRPLCRLESEDRKIEAELARHHLLR